jgi:hypothetical protein
VIAAGENADLVVRDFVDEAMLSIDAPGPAAGELVVLQRLWIPDAAEGVSPNGLDQSYDSEGFTTVLLNPPS